MCPNDEIINFNKPVRAVGAMNPLASKALQPTLGLNDSTFVLGGVIVAFVGDFR
ncbi:hypothetical protein L0657_05040 [Dyadobacter sp. CY345]|nr:hypothetical protein [Dyadobacter sp. CY345]